KIESGQFFRIGFASRSLRIFYFEKFVQLKDSIYIYTGNLIRKENANACSSGTARCAGRAPAVSSRCSTSRSSKEVACTSANPGSGRQAEKFPEPVFPQHPELMAQDDNYEENLERAGAGKRYWPAPLVYRAMNGWLFPYFK